MNNWQIAILVFSILLLVITVVNLVFDIFYTGWVIYISWFDNVLCLATGIMLICALRFHLEIKFYITSLIFLYISDVIAILVFVLCFIHDFLNIVKIIVIIMLTPLVVIVQILVNRFSVLNLPLLNTSKQSYQPAIYQPGIYQPQFQYQQENDPNIEPANYQPENIPTTQPNYQPPQYQDGNAPPSYEQQIQNKPGNEPSVKQEPGNQPGNEPIAPQSSDQALFGPGNESNRPTIS